MSSVDVTECEVNNLSGQIIETKYSFSIERQGSMSRGSLFDLMAQNAPVVAPGVYDMISCKLAERAGFPAIYVRDMVSRQHIWVCRMLAL